MGNPVRGRGELPVGFGYSMSEPRLEVFVRSRGLVCVHTPPSPQKKNRRLGNILHCIYQRISPTHLPAQPRPQGFSLKKWVGRPTHFLREKPWERGCSRFRAYFREL